MTTRRSTPSATGRVRLQRYLSQSGVAARRKAEDLITAGRVKVNGKVVSTLGSTVDPDSDRVQVDDQAVHPAELFYVVLNKPKGSITAVSDPEGRPTVMEWLPNLPVSVVPVGRLDFYSEGVLLLTNDGELSAALQAPDTHVEKTYHVKLRGEMPEHHIEAMRRGVKLLPKPDEVARPMGPRTFTRGEMASRHRHLVTRPAKVDRLKTASKHDWLVITLTEGKSRQIHRMAESLGHVVDKLQRVAFGGIDFHGLRVGDARELTQGEVNALYDQVGLPRNPRASARGKWEAKREATDIARRARARARDEAAGDDVAADMPRRTRATVARTEAGSNARPGVRRDPRSGDRTDGRPGARRDVRTDGARPGARRDARTDGARPGARRDARTDGARPGARRDVRTDSRPGARTNERRDTRGGGGPAPRGPGRDRGGASGGASRGGPRAAADRGRGAPSNRSGGDRPAGGRRKGPSSRKPGGR